jgi:hypothetical protein
MYPLTVYLLLGLHTLPVSTKRTTWIGKMKMSHPSPSTKVYVFFLLLMSLLSYLYTEIE